MLKKIKLNLYSNKYKVIPNFLSAHEIKNFSDSLYNEIYSLHKDYYSHISFHNFFNKMFVTQNRLMRALCYRFLDKNKLGKLKNKISEDVYINPLFYVFVINKKFFSSKLEKKAVMDTQYHYDFPYSLYANTYWIPLQDVNQETGTLCFPKTKKLISKFIPYKNYKNRYNLDRYYKNASKLDPLIKKDSDKLFLKAGSAVLWGSDVCHGALRAKKPGTTRVSFNFRTISKKVLYLSNIKTIKFVEDFNNDIDTFNFLNLMYIGDYKYCEREMKKNKKLLKFKNSLKELKSKKYKNLIKTKSFLRWQEEYSFVGSNLN